MTALRALIFDVDGTLAETEEIHRAAFNASFAAAGLSWCWDRSLYRELLAVTGGKERIRHFIATRCASPDLDAAAIAGLHRDKTARYTAMIAAGGVTPRPGIARLIAEAQVPGIRLAIATTTTRANVDALLDAALPGSVFNVIAAGDEVPAKKPAPDVYRLALQRLDLPATACVAFEDTLNGLQSALAAGLATVVTTSVYGGAGPFPGALAVVDHLGEPDLPARSLSGPPLRAGLVDLAQLDAWIEAAHAM